MRDLEEWGEWGIWKQARMRDLEVGENEVLRGGRKMRDFEEGGE